MKDVVATLRREHANIAQLLDILERQVALIERGARPDDEILEGIVDYFQSYPDLYHHPKEDLVFQKLRLRDPVAAQRVGDLRKEHDEIAACTRAFAAGVPALLEDSHPPAAAASAAARAFIHRQREHMAREEHLFFPAALRSLGPADWEDIDHRLTDQEDPLFGADVGGRYEALRRSILQLARVTHGCSP